MNTKIYYKVVGAFYRFKGNESDLIEIDETFEDENPIVARENSFECYQNYIDVLLQSKGEEYVYHEKAVSELKDFFISGRKHQLLPDLVDMDGTNLSIYMVKKTPDSFQAFEETYYQDKWQIHCIDCQYEDWSAYILKSLMYEYSFYIKNGYDCQNYLVACDTSKYFKNKGIQRILKTPMFIGLPAELLDTFFF